MTFPGLSVRELDQFTLQFGLQVASSTSACQTVVLFESSTSVSVQLEGDTVRVDLADSTIRTGLAVEEET